MEDQLKDQQSIKERIMQAARCGDIMMRPRWHFILKGSLIGIGVILAILALLYIASFTVFSLRETGAWFVPTFGPRGWLAFFRAMPWLLIALSVAFIALLEVLVRRYSFVYRKSLIVTLVLVLLIAVVGGILMAPFHHGIFRMVRRGPPPPIVGSLYRNFGFQRFPDVHRGIITSAATSSSTSFTTAGFVIEDPGGIQWTVRTGPRTRLPFGAEFEPGDTVIIFGQEHGRMIDAFGIRELVGEEP